MAVIGCLKEVSYFCHWSYLYRESEYVIGFRVYSLNVGHCLRSQLASPDFFQVLAGALNAKFGIGWQESRVEYSVLKASEPLNFEFSPEGVFESTACVQFEVQASGELTAEFFLGHLLAELSGQI